MPDITLEITVPEAHQTVALDAFNTIADPDILLQLRAKGINTSFSASWNFSIAPKSGETKKEFGERVLRKLGKAVIDMLDFKEDEERYDTEVAAIMPAASDVPEDILT